MEIGGVDIVPALFQYLSRPCNGFANLPTLSAVAWCCLLLRAKLLSQGVGFLEDVSLLRALFKIWRVALGLFRFPVYASFCRICLDFICIARAGVIKLSLEPLIEKNSKLFDVGICDSIYVVVLHHLRNNTRFKVV